MVLSVEYCLNEKYTFSLLGLSRPSVLLKWIAKRMFKLPSFPQYMSFGWESGVPLEMGWTLQQLQSHGSRNGLVSFVGKKPQVMWGSLHMSISKVSIKSTGQNTCILLVGTMDAGDGPQTGEHQLRLLSKVWWHAGWGRWHLVGRVNRSCTTYYCCSISFICWIEFFGVAIFC